MINCAMSWSTKRTIHSSYYSRSTSVVQTYVKRWVVILPDRSRTETRLINILICCRNLEKLLTRMVIWLYYVNAKRKKRHSTTNKFTLWNLCTTGEKKFLEKRTKVPGIYRFEILINVICRKILLRLFRRYVLPNSMLLEIVETLPSDMQGILNCCGPNLVSPLVQENLVHLHELILEARNLPLEVNRDL